MADLADICNNKKSCQTPEKEQRGPHQVLPSLVAEDGYRLRIWMDAARAAQSAGFNWKISKKAVPIVYLSGGSR